MPLFRRREESINAPVLVASAEAVNVADSAQAQSIVLGRQPWQNRAWGYYDEIGELHFAARFIGNALSKIRLVGAEVPESSSDEPLESENKIIKEAVHKLKSPMGGQGGLMRNLGLNIFIAGECYLLGREDENGDQQWEVASINELEIRVGDRRAYRRKTPVQAPAPIPEDTLIVRVWSAHPRYTNLADGAVRTILDECEKLLLLTRADKAAARSRFAGAGLLFIPNELMPVSQQPSGQGIGEAADNPIYKNLIDSMVTPIRDEQHPSGVVPITIFGPGEYGDKIRYLTFDRPQASRAQQQREESITRIATALDLPAEILTGKADLNHWAAWQVHEETFSQHLQPLVELICDSLTIGYLHPALKNAGVKDYQKYLIWYDDSALVVRPDKGQTASALYNANVINAAAYRRETGFAETDGMDEKEYAKRVGILLNDANLALTGEQAQQPGAPPAPGGPQPGGDRPTLEEKMSPAKEMVDTKEKAATQGVPKTEKPQDNKSDGTKPITASAAKQKRRRRPVGVQLAQLDVELMTQLRTAATEALIRELDRAGARIRSRVQNNPEQKELLKDVPNHMVASVLGPTLVAAANDDSDDRDLLAGAFLSFTSRAGMLLTAAQRERLRLLAQRFPSTDGDSASTYNDFEREYGEEDQGNLKTALTVLSAGLLALALEKLYAPRPDTAPPGEGEFDDLLVPARLIRQVVSTAGGSNITSEDLTDEELTNEDFGGIGTGRTTHTILRDQGADVLGYQWVYGPAIRVPFGAHEELDGVEFTSFEDEVLAVQPSDEWLGVDYYRPGDHWGCLCAVAPLLAGDAD